MRQDVYYQRGAADPILDESLVMEIVRQYAPEAKGIQRIDETGGEARTYHVDDNITLKVQRPQQLRRSTSLEREVFFLRQLEQHLNVSVPRVLGYGKKGTVEYNCMTRMPGIAVRYAEWTPAERRAMLFELGKMLRIIHSIDQKPFLDSGIFLIDDEADLVDRLRNRAQNTIKRKREERANVKSDEALQKIEAELSKIKNVGQFVALHVNPATTHTFVDEKTKKLNGLIDFGDTYIGHPIFDLWRWGTADRNMLFDGYTAEKPVDDGFKTIYDAAFAIDEVADTL